MKTVPKVSAVIAAYNVAPYIEQCIDSLLQQSLEEIEIIVVDDCSSDGTRDMINAFAAKSPKVRPVLHAKNQGVGVARNTAINHATGDWVAIVDSDDWIAPKRFETMLEMAVQKSADMVADDQFLVSSNPKKPTRQLLCHNENDGDQMGAADFLRRDAPETAGYGLLKPLIRKSFLDEHNIRYRVEYARIEDCLLYCDCLANNAKFLLCTEPMYYYRTMRDGSLTAQVRDLDALRLMSRGQDFIEELFKNTPDSEVQSAVSQRRQLINDGIYYREVVACLKDRKFLQAAGNLLSDVSKLPVFAYYITRAARNRLKLNASSRNDAKPAEVHSQP